MGFKKAKNINRTIKKRREERMNQPFNIRLAPGDERTVVIVDAVPEFMYIHHFAGADGKWNNFVRCIKETDSCPLCADDKKYNNSSYCTLFTCVDLEPYTDRKGKKHKFSRKILPFKTSMVGKLERLQKKYGTFDGLVVKLIRDGDKDPSTGNDIEVVKRIKPDVMRKKYGKEAEPIDWDKAYPHYSAEELRSMYGGSKVRGSEDVEEDYDEDEWDEDDED